MENKYLKISFLGDIMCKQQMLSQAATEDNRYDFSKMMIDVKSLLDDSDYVVGNLETPLSLDNKNLVHDKYIFNAPFEFADTLRDIGIDCVSFANNHCLDRGVQGVLDTISVLDKRNIKILGVNKSSEKKLFIENIKNVKIGFMSYTYGTNADENNVYLDKNNRWIVNQLQKQELSNKIERYCVKHYKKFIPRCYNKMYRILHPSLKGKSLCERRQNDFYEIKQLKKEIKLLKKQNLDFLMMCLHIGGQYNASPTKYTLDTIKLLKRHGVNIVIGNHEHIVQGCEKGSLDSNFFATYSLGNFLGVGGLLQEPYDKFVNYSIACHIYIDTVSKKLNKVTYSILKTIFDTNKNIVRTIPVNELAKNLEEPELSKLRRDIEQVVYMFSGVRYENIDFKDEYNL